LPWPSDIASLFVSPNPATNQDLISITFDSPSQGQGTITIIDLGGRIANDRVINVAEGLNVHQWNTVDMRSGYYSVICQTEVDRLVQPLIITE